MGAGKTAFGRYSMIDIEKEIEKENRRTTFEWEAFLKKYGPINNYDDLSQEGKEASLELAEKQGLRSKRIWDEYNEAASRVR